MWLDRVRRAVSSCSPSLCTPMSMAASLCMLCVQFNCPRQGKSSAPWTEHFCDSRVLLVPLDKGELPRLEGRTYILREEFETTEWIVCIFLSLAIFSYFPFLPYSWNHPFPRPLNICSNRKRSSPMWSLMEVILSCKGRQKLFEKLALSMC